MKVLRKQTLLIDSVIFFFSFSIFYITIHHYKDADITVHNEFIQAFNQGKIPMNGHFLFFIVVSVLSFFSANYNFIITVSSIVLSLMIILKRITTELLIEKINNDNRYFEKYYFIVSVLFIFLTNMPSHPPFNGIWPPISWINSTVIFVFPFCILLFYYSYLYVDNLSFVNLIKLMLLALLILISKPSYIFIFVVAYPIFTFIKHREVFWKSIILSMLLMILIFIQYQYIYHFYIQKIKLLNFNYDSVKITIDFFGAWRRISSNIIISSITWFSLPVSIMVLYGKKLIKEQVYVYALIGFLIGFLIFITFEEKVAAGYAHGALNFLWQLIISLYIWSVVSMALVLKYFRERGYLIWKDKVIFMVFIYYVLSAIAYLFNTVFMKIL